MNHTLAYYVYSVYVEVYLFTGFMVQSVFRRVHNAFKIPTFLIR